MADYPRELNLDTETKERLASYLDTELSNHISERADFVQDLVEWQKDYWAKPSTEEVTFPFKGAATIIIPLSAITIEATHARTMTTLFALDQFVTVKSQHEDYIEMTRPVERMLDHELLNNIKIFNPVNDAVLELIKYGTGVMKTGYEKVTKTAVRPVAEGEKGEEEEFKVVTKQGATIDAIPISRFVMPFSYQDIQSAPWCGEEHEGDAYTVRQFEESGFFREGASKDLIGYYNANLPPDDFKENQQEQENREPFFPSSIKWYEIWLSFDMDRTPSELQEFGDLSFPPDGEQKEIVIHYHKESGTFLSVRYNWRTDLSKPYFKGVYFPVEHRWAGLGACKQLDQFQREITTQHRQRLDNATLANVRMIKVSTSSRYGPDEPVFPGKIWFVDDKDDVDSFQLGEIYPSSYSNENQTLSYAQQRGGVNELNLGMPQVGTPGTATAELSRVQESNKRFDFTYRNTKRFVKEVVRDTAVQIRQFGLRNDLYLTSVTGSEQLNKFMNLPIEAISQGILLEIDVAGQQANKLLDRQNYQQLAPIVQQYFDGALSLAQATGDQAKVQLIASKGLIAITELFRQMLETYDIKNIDRIALMELLNANPESAERTPAGLILPPNGQGIQVPPNAPPTLPTAIPNGVNQGQPIS